MTRQGEDWAAQSLLSRLGRGSDAARTIGDLQEELGWTRRQVELALRALRLDGWPIGSGGSGVWIADIKELDATIESLRRRIATQRKTLTRQRELRDQMRARLIQQTTLGWDDAA